MRKLTLITIAVAFLAVGSFAQSSYPPPGGWGTNWTNTIIMGGGYSVVDLLHVPNGAAPGYWNAPPAPGTPFVFPGITVELWVEMILDITWNYTTVQMHYAGHGPSFIYTFYLCGLISSNSPQQIAITYTGMPLCQLTFMEDIFGLNPGGVANPCIHWFGVWGTGTPPTTPTYGSNDELTPDPDIYMTIPLCQHWFCFIGEICINEHIEDGYYLLEAGTAVTPSL